MPPTILDIFYPNGKVEAVQVFVWDVPTLQPKLWDGSLSAGSLTIGTVDQGLGGASAWLVDVTDKPTRDLGKVDVASLDQYTPVSGRLPVDGSGVTQPVSAASLPLPTGAATEATLATRLADATFTSRINTQGQKTMAGSTPVVLASDQSPISTKTDLTPSAPTSATVGVASGQVVAANASRKGLILVNTSVNRISLGFGSPAVLDNGPTLYPGGTFNMEEYDFDLGAVNAIASAAGSNLAIQEYTT